jgi:phosphatidylserine/phosphatidylglycerophosphate/cardiolipin synthase-like enzyme
MAVPLPATPPWFLPFTSATVAAPTGGGRPWADGTEMALRAQPGAANPNPWDDHCRVTTYIDGFEAMSAMRNALEDVISAANAPGAPPMGQRGYVYIADWRFNCLRDLSENNSWLMGPWPRALHPGYQALLDQTAMGLVVRLLQAGVMVRIMVWLPYVAQSTVVDLSAHVLDHYLAAQIVHDESNRVTPPGNPYPPGVLPPGAVGPPGVAYPLGVVALDSRTADPWSGSHHQKMMLIRCPLTAPPTVPNATHVAFVGGVDFAYTRRSCLNSADPRFGGDWQSGQTIPDPAQWWPQQVPQPPAVNYGFQAPGQVPVLKAIQGSDLPESVYGDPGDPGGPVAPGGQRQMWHDQHLKLEGPIVQTIEHQFRERWVDQASGLYELGPLGSLRLRSGQVIFSTAAAYAGGQILPLPSPPALPVPVAPPALPPGLGTQVQMWRTIPLRKARTGPPFWRGEFTVMAGIAKAVGQAQELIWMFDQYFWSLPLARLLNTRLRNLPGLRLILILPPYADDAKAAGRQHLTRNDALQALTDQLQRDPNTGALTQVGVYNMWNGQSLGAVAANRGIYVHAKSHTYDNSLLVCGSANLNRRSFLCDTELACAVLDPAVVTAHQQRLWAQLFPSLPAPGGAVWPAATNLATGGGGGAAFFTAFQAAALVRANSLLFPDPWEGHWTLPKNITRPVDDSLPFYNDAVVEPSSVNITKLEDQAYNRPVQLNKMVSRLEYEPGFNGDFPCRKQ